MNPVALVLVSCSALTHALWNFISKRSRPSLGYFLAASASGCILLLPALVSWWGVVRWFPLLVWVLLGVTGFCQAVYYTGLSLAYRRGELSFSYPVARGLPVVVVPLVSRLIGTGNPISALSAAGMFLIAAGVLVMPMRWPGPGAGSGTRTAVRGLVFPAIAAAGTVGYSLIDDAALRIIASGTAISFSTAQLSVVYSFFETVSSALWLVPAVFVAKAHPRAPAGGGERIPWGSALLSGLLITAAYTMVLVAMNYSRNVGYIIAFRQLSVPLGALMGIVFLRERPTAGRVAGLLGVTAGLVLVARG